jgi:hypothetical protein
MTTHLLLENGDKTIVGKKEAPWEPSAQEENHDVPAIS